MVAENGTRKQGYRSLDEHAQRDRDKRNLTAMSWHSQYCYCPSTVPLPRVWSCNYFFSAVFCIIRYLHFSVKKKKKKYNKTSVSYITFKVTCIKCTKSTFLLMEWPFANEVISDITAKKRGVFLSPFLPFLKPSEVANFVAFAVCAQYFNQLYKVMCFLNSYCVCWN